MQTGAGPGFIRAMLALLVLLVLLLRACSNPARLSAGPPAERSVESMNLCIALVEPELAKTVLNEVLGSIVPSRLVVAPDNTTGRTWSGPPMSKECLLACAEASKQDLFSHAGSVLSGLWGGRDIGSVVGSAVGDVMSRCSEVQTLQSLGGTIVGLDGLEVDSIQTADAIGMCNIFNNRFNVTGHFSLRVGDGRQTWQESLASHGAGGGIVEMKIAARSDSLCSVKEEEVPAASMHLGPFALLARLCNATLSADFSLEVEGCTMLSMKLAEVSVGWDAADLGSHDGEDLSADIPFRSFHVGPMRSLSKAEMSGANATRGDFSLVVEEELADETTESGAWWSSLSSTLAGSIDERFIRPQIDSREHTPRPRQLATCFNRRPHNLFRRHLAADAQTALNQLLALRLPRPMPMLPALQHILPGCELYDTMEQFGPPGKIAASGLQVGEQVTGNVVVGATEVAGDMLSGDVLSASGDVLSATGGVVGVFGDALFGPRGKQNATRLTSRDLGSPHVETPWWMGFG